VRFLPLHDVLQLNFPGLNERRCIVRQALGFYRILIVGGTYSWIGSSAELFLQEATYKALKHCVSVHPILSAVIINEETEAPVFARPESLSLDNHADFLDIGDLVKEGNASDEQALIKLAFSRTHDQTFESCDKIPPWKVVVLPLSAEANGAKSRFLILFAYYHSHGDGKSGLAFHKTFLEGLRLASGPDSRFTSTKEHKTPDMPLLPSMEQAGKLTISWSYLLSPLFGAYLPTFLGFRASATPEAPDQWRGGVTNFDPSSFTTSLDLLTIDNPTMQKVLKACRARGTKFTGLLHQLIVRALSQTLPADTPAGSFVSQTAVDLRKNLDGITDDDMALCPTGYYELFPRTEAQHWADWTSPSSSDGPVWTAARATTAKLAACASTLHDQPIGLLKYLRDFYSWTRNQLDKPRDSSYEVSNLLSFDPGAAQAGKDGWDVERMLFSQPANAVGICLSCNAVSRAGGDFVVMISWQTGALGVEDEQGFVAKVCGSIRASVDELANA